MLQRLLIFVTSRFSKKKEESPVWLHQLKIKHCEFCPPQQPHCAIVWENGKVMEKCQYAKMDNKNPEMAVMSKTGEYIGVRCIPSQAIDFILGDS